MLGLLGGRQLRRKADNPEIHSPLGMEWPVTVRELLVVEASTNYAYGTSPGVGGSSKGAYFYPPTDPNYPSIDQMMAVLGNNWYNLRRR